MIAIITKVKVCVISRSGRLRRITQTDNYRYHAKTEFNNCLLMHIPKLHFQRQEFAQKSGQ